MKTVLRKPLWSMALALMVAAVGNAQHSPSSQASSTQQSSAEAVFASTASKVVLLISKKSGVPYKLASGVILSSDGYIATNYHALQGADAIEIRFFPDPRNTETYESFNTIKILYTNADRDIAIVKVDSNLLPFLSCKTKSGCEPRIGESVYAIGNPEGLTNTISEGIVSALRSTGNQNIIQHTAPLSHGSSGGALVDSNGNLLGMNSWQMADGQNLNFAIAASYISEALITARQATSTLNFPPDNVSQENSESQESDRKLSEPAVTALRSIADKIKECPKTIYFEMRRENGPLSGMRIYLGPPVDVVWDVVRSDSARSPYLGIVEFTLPQENWVPPDVYQKYQDGAADIYVDLLLKPLSPTKYRYEFDVGPTGLHLTKMLNRLAGKEDWTDAINQQACSVEGCVTPCWESVAQNGQTSPEKASR